MKENQNNTKKAPSKPAATGSGAMSIYNNIVTQKNENVKSFSNIFLDVREGVPVRAAAERYGLRVNRAAFTNCPFHDDRHPSLKLYDDHFHCFACQAHGDVTMLAAKLLGLSQLDAAKQLAADFGIAPDTERKISPDFAKQIAAKAALDEKACKLVEEYIRLLYAQRDKYAPASPEEEFHPYYAAALQELPAYECQLNLIRSDQVELNKFIERGGIRELHTKIRIARMA